MLGFPHPDYLWPYLSAGQWIDWQRFASRHGLGVSRDDIHWGMLMSIVANMVRSEGQPPFSTTDLMPYHDPYEEEITVDELRGRVSGMLLRARGVTSSA